MEKLIKIVAELKEVISKIDHQTKMSLVHEHKELNDILFERPHYFYPILGELKLFEKKFDIILCEELKSAIEIVGSRGYNYSGIFNYNISSYYPIESFFSEKFVEILIQNNIDKEEIEEGYYDRGTKEFNSKSITEIYNAHQQKEDLLIDYISFDETVCGWGKLLILNGSDKNRIGHENYTTYVFNNEKYYYDSYLPVSEEPTIFDVMYREVNEMKIFLQKEFHNIILVFDTFYSNKPTKGKILIVVEGKK